MAVLTNIRHAIAEDPEFWMSIIREKDFAETYEIEGESLKRPPKGFDADHPLIDEIKRKDFVGVCRLSEKQALAPDFMFSLAEIWGKSRRFMEFLTVTAEQPF